MLKEVLKQESKNKVAMSVLYAIMGAFFLSLMSLCVKFLPNLPAVQILVVRSVITITIVNFVSNKYNVDCYPSSNEIMTKLIIRGILGSIDSTVWFMAIKLISLSEAIVLAKTVPFWTTLIAVFILHREKLTFQSVLNILLCLLGVALIARPPFIKQLLDDGDVTEEIKYENHTLGVICALGSAILTSVIQVVISKLGTQVNQLTIVQYFSFLSIFTPTIYQLYSPFGGFVFPSAEELLFIILAGVTGCLGQLLMSRSFIIGELTQISLVNQSQVIISFIFDILILHQALNLLSLFGTFLVMSSLILVIIKRPQK